MSKPLSELFAEFRMAGYQYVTGDFTGAGENCQIDQVMLLEKLTSYQKVEVFKVGSVWYNEVASIEHFFISKILQCENQLEESAEYNQEVSHGKICLHLNTWQIEIDFAIACIEFKYEKYTVALENNQ